VSLEAAEGKLTLEFGCVKLQCTNEIDPMICLASCWGTHPVFQLQGSGGGLE